MTNALHIAILSDTHLPKRARELPAHVWSAIDTADVVFYLSFIGIGLFLTHRVLDSFRWR